MSIQLVKHHAQGNDFLVLLDPEGDVKITPETVVALCDRRRGVGADGLIRALRPEDLEPFAKPYEIAAVMELFNADGSRAEMSGNGIRCLGQALWRAGMAQGDQVLIVTDAGTRKLTLRQLRNPSVATITTTMGSVRIQRAVTADDLSWLDPSSLGAVERGLEVRVGNPHLVLLVEDTAVFDLVRAGQGAQSAYPAGVNLEIIALREGRDDLVDMVVFERGVGPTLACGTGSCAAAAASRHWGLVSGAVTVVNPGGPLDVAFEGDEALLGGDVVHIADIRVDLAMISTS